MIRDAAPADYPAIAELMRAFIRWHYQRHASDRALIDSYFDEAAYEAELSGWFHALSDGGTVTQPLEKAPWGDTFGMLVDRFGVQWMLVRNPKGAM